MGMTCWDKSVRHLSPLTTTYTHPSDQDTRKDLPSTENLLGLHPARSGSGGQARAARGCRRARGSSAGLRPRPSFPRDREPSAAGILGGPLARSHIRSESALRLMAGVQCGRAWGVGRTGCRSRAKCLWPVSQDSPFWRSSMARLRRKNPRRPHPKRWSGSARPSRLSWTRSPSVTKPPGIA